MLIACENENDDRKIKADDLSDCRRCADRDPDGDADEHIAQDAAQEGIGKRKRGLGNCGVYEILGELSAEKSGSMAVNENGGYEYGTAQVSQIYEKPASYELRSVDSFLKERNDQQGVSCEQLAAR